jgi:hypothetical protein
MYERVEKPQENKSRAVANSVAQKKNNVKQGFGFVDNRTEMMTQRKKQDILQLSVSNKSGERCQKGEIDSTAVQLQSDGKAIENTLALSNSKVIQKWAPDAATNCRLSTLGNVAVDQGTQTLYATAAVIAGSNVALAAKKSTVRLIAGAAAPGGLLVVNIAFHGVKLKTSAEEDGGAQHISLSAARVVDPLFLWADCSKSSAEVSGSTSDNRSGDKVMTSQGPKSGEIMEGLTGQETEASASKFANAMYITSMDKFLQIHCRKHSAFLKEGIHYVQKTGSLRWSALPLGRNTKFKDDNEMKRAGYKTEIPKSSGPRARYLYESLGAIGKEVFDAYNGINDFAAPNVGDSYTMATEHANPAFTKVGGKRTWLYHYAGVIIVDGDDRVTLENYAVDGQKKLVNSDWGFYMYGTKTVPGAPANGATFNEEHLATGTHGSRATAMTVENA